MSRLGCDHTIELKMYAPLCYLRTSTSKPVDIRAKGDTGAPLHSEHFAFCLFCEPQEIRYHKTKGSRRFEWPARETLNIQNAVKLMSEKSVHLDVSISV